VVLGFVPSTCGPRGRDWPVARSLALLSRNPSRSRPSRVGGIVLRVLIDTNVLCADYYLKGTAARLLLDSAKRRDVQILIPVVVLGEAVRRFGEETHELIRDMGGWRNKLARVVPDLGSFEAIKASLGKQANSYELYLKSTLGNSNAVLLSLPEISHERMLDRVLARRKPVKTDGRGYQDALVWETILEQKPSETYPIHFITDNWTDFATNAQGGELASDLIVDLHAIGSTENAVRLYRRLRDFTDEHVKPTREVVVTGVAPSQAAKNSLVEVDSILGAFLDGYASQMIGSSVDSYELSKDYAELDIEDAQFRDNLNVTEVFWISEQEIGVAGEAAFDAALQAWIWTQEDPSIVSDWPEDDGFYLSSVSLRGIIHIEFEATIDASEQEVIEFRPLRSWADDIDSGSSSSEVHPGQGKLWE